MVILGGISSNRNNQQSAMSNTSVSNSDNNMCDSYNNNSGSNKGCDSNTSINNNRLMVLTIQVATINNYNW
jgi:hypothetical protein